MLTHRIHACIKVMVGFVAMFASVHAQGENPNGDGLLVQEGPFVEIVYVDIGLDESIECIAADPGYVDLDEEANGEAIISEDYSVPLIVIEPPGIRVFRFVENGLPQIIDEVYFDEDALGLYGHDYVTTVPFPTQPIPSPEQLVTLNTDNGGTIAVLLESTVDPDLNIDCTVFDLDADTDGYYLDATGQAAKKKAVKKKIAKANKRKVNKKKAKKKAAAKRKKAKRKVSVPG